jgi:hypothetical protein
MKRLFVSAILMVVALGLGTSPIVADPPDAEASCQRECALDHSQDGHICHGSPGCEQFQHDLLVQCIAACVAAN